MLENVYSFKIPHGQLFLYGDNLKMCRRYIDDAVRSVEDICAYCSEHNIRIYHKPNRSLSGLLEKCCVYKLTKKYHVRSSWKELKAYILLTYS